MDDHLDIPLRDGARATGVITINSGAPMVIIIHGLGGTMSEHLLYNSAALFALHGYSTLRFDLYSGKDHCRRLVETDLATQITDVIDVISWVEQEFPRIPYVLAGHSLGGMLAIAAQKPTKTILLWDAAYPPALSALTNLVDIPEQDVYRKPGGIDILFNKKMVEQLRNYDPAPYTTSITCPVLIFASLEEDFRLPNARKYQENLSGVNRLIAVPDSDHGFNKIAAENTVKAESLAWIQQHCPVTG